jgi:hypothetical protein
MKARFKFVCRTLLAAALMIGLGIAPASAQHIFWSDTGGFVAGQGTIWTAALDGSGKNAIATGLSRPIGIGLDPGRGHVYWAEDGFQAAPSLIVRANLDGTEPVTLFSQGEDGFTNAQMLGLDLRRGHVYWTDFILGVIRGNLDGTGYQVIGGSASRYTALALDLVNDHIYYGDPTGNGVLYRMDLNGGNDIFIAGNIAALDWRFNAIAVDGVNGLLYYTDTGTHEIKRMNTNGSNHGPLLTDPGLAPFGIALGPENKIYWVGGGRRLGVANVDGSGATLNLVEIGPTPFGITVMPERIGPDLVAMDSLWRFNEMGFDLGTAWRDLGYDDSAWSEGAGVLGFDDSLPQHPYPLRTILTPVDGGGALTTYFRHTFVIPAAAQFTALRLRTLVDDGAVFYLNGTEVLRLRMPDGPISNDTAALVSVEAELEGPFSIPAGLLRDGPNVLAAEVHQASPGVDDDIVFGLELIGVSQPIVQPILIIERHPVTLDVHLIWSDKAFTLESAPTVDGPWAAVPNQAIPYPIRGTETRFYRLQFAE